MHKEFPHDTLYNRLVDPWLRAIFEINHGDPGKAVELMEEVRPYEFGFATTLLSAYDRGLAYLKLKKGPEAAAEFRRALDHRGVDRAGLEYALSYLGLARAYALQGDSAKRRTANQDFFALWKDPHVPILKEARAEYAKLQ